MAFPEASRLLPPAGERPTAHSEPRLHVTVLPALHWWLSLHLVLSGALYIHSHLSRGSRYYASLCSTTRVTNLQAWDNAFHECTEKN